LDARSNRIQAKSGADGGQGQTAYNVERYTPYGLKSVREQARSYKGTPYSLFVAILLVSRLGTRAARTEPAPVGWSVLHVPLTPALSLWEGAGVRGF